MKYKLIIKWETGEYEHHLFNDEKHAQEIADGYLKAFGKQVEWYGIVPVSS